jgi:hypothetical protein
MLLQLGFGVYPSNQPVGKGSIATIASFTVTFHLGKKWELFAMNGFHPTRSLCLYSRFLTPTKKKSQEALKSVKINTNKDWSTVVMPGGFITTNTTPVMMFCS